MNSDNYSVAHRSNSPFYYGNVFQYLQSHQFQKGVDSFLDVVAADNILLITETWRDREIQFSPLGELDFYAFKNNFPVKFRRNTEGEIFQLVAFERDVWDKVE